MTAAWVAGTVLVVWFFAGLTFAPIIGARFAGRPTTPQDRELVGFAGLGLFIGLFVLALLVIGTR